MVDPVRLVFGPSVIGLETEDIPAASSAYFATPLRLCRLSLPARQEKLFVLAQSCLHPIHLFFRASGQSVLFAANTTLQGHGLSQ